LNDLKRSRKNALLVHTDIEQQGYEGLK
jgi:hypothetical protein